MEYLRGETETNVMDKAFYHAGDFIKFIIRLLSVWWPLFDVGRALAQLFRQSWMKWRKQFHTLCQEKIAANSFLTKN